MLPDQRFLNQPKHFWANVRTISAVAGYTEKRSKKRAKNAAESAKVDPPDKGQIKVPSMDEIELALSSLDLTTAHLIEKSGKQNRLGMALSDYFAYRAETLNSFVEPRLMSGEEAKKEFDALCKRLKNAKCPRPMNKQKGDKKAPAYLTAIVNMLIEENAGGLPCDFDPRALTTITRDNAPLRTLARRVDGAFPRSVNPIAIWEIKEYYYTTTFGSRVADGVYETLLDGMELEELRKNENVKVRHYLMVDAHYTWWVCGRSYLCRIFDMLHMGYVNEVLFGREVIERMPAIVKEWVRLAKGA